jgi:hypothetical protein
MTMKTNTETKTRQWDQLIGILPSKEGLVDFGAFALGMLILYPLAAAPFFLVLWAMGII